VIDWETAAVGPQYVDLVSISSGRWGPAERLAMRRAYFEARQSLGGCDATWGRFNEEVDMVALLQAVSWLAWWLNGDAAHFSRWVREIEFVAAGRRT
jgi:aminoglycoside phosphotransferase (APT) family kinase protein